tara:strand:- start:595 stop:1062 length:468 start_codon:yes stop_codon:yes gene_type:complete
MANPRYGGFSNVGTATIITDPLPSLSTTRQLIQVRVPTTAHLESAEIHLSSAGAATSATLAIFRDAPGDLPCVGDGTSAATQTLTVGTTTATDKGAVWLIQRDVVAIQGLSTFSDADLAPTITARAQTQNLWVGLKLNAGTATLDRLILNWRSGE